MAGRDLKSRFGGFVVFALIYAGLNGALWVGQELLSRDEQREAERIEAELGMLGHEIDEAAAWLERKSNESDAIDALGAQLGEPARYASTGAYEADRRRFNRQVDEWNEGLARLEAEIARHDGLVEEYNALVDEYDQVADAAYARWWLLPIPLPRRAGRAAAH